MDKIDEMLHILGRIEGKMDNLDNLPKRVAMLEEWQALLKGGITVLAGGFAYLWRILYSK